MTAVEDDDDDHQAGSAHGGLSPYEELRALGQLGPVQYAWVIKLVRQVGRASGFPPPSGAAWNSDAARHWLADQLSGTKGPEFFVRVGATATDDASYTRLARRSIKNAMIDEARGTTAGLMRLRMRGLLMKQPDFVDHTKEFAGTAAWSLVGLTEIWAGDFEELLRAPGLAAIEPIEKLNAAGPTSAENIEKLVRAARTLISFAGGALTDQVLATAIVRVFELDELAPYGLTELDIDPAAERAIERVEIALDWDNGWYSEIEHMAPAEWLVMLAEADALLKGFVWVERLSIAVGDEDLSETVTLLPGTSVSATYVKSVLARFRERVATQKPSKEAVKVALASCLELLDVS
ncbi:MAG: hypothetical protein JWP19_2202 [Rhodoglobus sp.]|nr:hypothetical protein [Rhodoglobus sp.]